MNEEKSKNSWVIIAAVVISLLIGGLIGGLAFSKEVIIDAEESEIDCPELNETECEEYETCATCEEQEQEFILKEGYLLNNLFLGKAFVETLSDREILLFDDEVEFDRDDYDAEEIFSIDSARLEANSPDFEGNAYLTFPAGSLKYEFVFETGLDMNLIGSDGYEDEFLEFSLLGQDVTISKWNTEDDDNEVTLILGTKYVVEEDETITVNGVEITVRYVLENVVYIAVDGLEKPISVGSIKSYKDANLEIKVDEAFDYHLSTNKKSRAILIIGEDIETTISNRDEYEEDSIWEWVITPNSIGLILVEDFVEFDEEFNALQPEDILCLPNDYVCVRYNGLIGQDTEEYDFDIKGNFTRIKGNFLSGITDYDTIYIYEGMIYSDDDDSEEYEIGTSVELGDTESILTLDEDSINIGVDEDVYFSLIYEIYEEEYKFVSYADGELLDDDVDYLTNYGILVENPEDSIEHQEFTITVPEEQAEGIITVKKFGFEVEDTEEDNEEEDAE